MGIATPAQYAAMLDAASAPGICLRRGGSRSCRST